MRLKSMISALALAVATQASSETLTFATTNPETAPIVAEFLVPWAESISENAGIDVMPRHGSTIANHTNFYDRVVDGVVDMSWGMTVFNPGKFTNSLVMTIPLFVSTSEQGSLAACEMYYDGHFGADYDGLRPLLFIQFPHSVLHTTETPIDNGMDSIAGLKMIALSPAATEITLGNGGTPVSVMLGEAYETLQRGAADGMIIGYTAFETFRLGEHLKHHYDTPLGGALGVVFITEERYQSLSDEAKAALDEHSTCEWSRQFGAWADEWNDAEREAIVSQPGHTLTVMSDEEIQETIGYVGDAIIAGYSNFPGGRPLVDAMFEALDEASAAVESGS